MSANVGQHQQSVFTLPNNTPAVGDALDAEIVKGNDNSLRAKYNAHDNDGTIHFLSGPIASRPSAGTADRKFFSTDSPRRIFLDTGVTWVEVEYEASGTAATTDFFTFFIAI